MEYKLVGNHAEDLADGRMLAPGETVELDEDQVREPRIEQMLADGVLIGTEESSEHEADLAERRVHRRTTKKAEGGDEE